MSGHLGFVWPALLLVQMASASPAGADTSKAATTGARRGAVIEITVIQALRTDGGSSIDPRLHEFPQLTREQPFLRYNVYRLLDRRELPLEDQRAVVDPLPNGRTLQVSLVDISGERGGARRFHIRAAIDDPGKQAFLKLLEVTAGLNEPFFVGGQSYDGGTLFLEIAVRP